jgi:DegV family protein with EDD domain
VIALCTDSSSLLPAAAALELGVAVAPIGVTLDGRSFEDGVDLDADTFYARLEQGARATTSQPTPGRFAELYEAAAARGATELLSIHVDERLSGTVGAATLAAREAPLPVTVVDSGTASFGVAICVLAAAEALAAGESVAAAVARIRRIAAGIGTVFVAGGAPNGRIASAPGLPLLTYTDGHTRPVGSASGLDDAAAAMSAFIAEQGKGLRVAVGHAGAATRSAADLLAEQLAVSGVVVDVTRYRVGPSVGAHTGPRSFGAFWWAP